MSRVLTWIEPNRARTPPLHIASHGERYSSLTGAWWLDERRLVVNHRSGLRLALFDLDAGDAPVAVAPIPHLTDAVTARPVDTGTWDVAVSGCWACAYSVFRLTLAPAPAFRLLRSVPRRDRSFAHGVRYDLAGNLWVAYSTGARPRLEGTGRTWSLPAPWGPRETCQAADGTVYALATLTDPKRSTYAQTAASVWRLDGQSWTHVLTIPEAHTDAGQVWDGRLYLNDQRADDVMVVDLAAARVADRIRDASYSFPHGLGVSPAGRLAVTNYGTSTVTISDLAAVALAG